MKIVSKVGKAGEDAATIYLKKLGHKILARNFSTRYGEIDIVAQDKNTLVFVEVKARKSDEYGTPQEAVSYTKLSRLRKAIEYFVMLHPKLPQSQRIDVIAITYDASGKPTTEHLINATG